MLGIGAASIVNCPNFHHGSQCLKSSRCAVRARFRAPSDFGLACHNTVDRGVRLARRRLMLALTSDFRMRDADDDGANVEMLGNSWWRARWVTRSVGTPSAVGGWWWPGPLTREVTDDDRKRKTRRSPRVSSG